MGTRDINISLCRVRGYRIACHYIVTQASKGIYGNIGRKTPPTKVFSFNGELLYYFGCLTTEHAAKHTSGTKQISTGYQTGTSGWKDDLQHYRTTIQSHIQESSTEGCDGWIHSKAT